MCFCVLVLILRDFGRHLQCIKGSHKEWYNLASNTLTDKLTLDLWRKTLKLDYTFNTGIFLRWYCGGTFFVCTCIGAWGEMGSKLSYIPTSLLLEINYRRRGVIFCKALKRWLKVYHQQHYLKTENYWLEENFTIEKFSLHCS